MRRYAPLAEGHPTIGEICPACRRALAVGDVVTLIAIGPGDDAEEQERAREGGVYTAVAVPAHWRCATGKADDQD
jgi:hypothetical protein